MAALRERSLGPPELPAAAATCSPRSAAAEIRRVGWLGLVGNLALAIVKFIAGFVGHSQAVVADAVHSVTDIATDLAVLFGVRYWTAPADERHPHGHHRIETLITVAIGLTLVAVAFGIGFKAVHDLVDRRPSTTPTFVALIAAALSIVTKEWLYRWTATVGRRIGSQALVANAWHHRSDAFSSIPAVLAVATAMIAPRLAAVDRIGAIAVCGFILYAAWKIVAPALAQLADAGAPPEDCERLEALALAVDGVDRAHAIRTRYKGNLLSVDLHVEVDGKMTVSEGFEIARRVKHQLRERGPGVADVVVQVEPRRGQQEITGEGSGPGTR